MLIWLSIVACGAIRNLILPRLCRQSASGLLSHWREELNTPDAYRWSLKSRTSKFKLGGKPSLSPMGQCPTSKIYARLPSNTPHRFDLSTPTVRISREVLDHEVLPSTTAVSSCRRQKATGPSCLASNLKKFQGVVLNRDVFRVPGDHSSDHPVPRFAPEIRQ